MTEQRTQPPGWWHDAVGYCLYLRSFADGDGDGVGDLPGLCRRLDHLVALGIDLLWVTPFHPSPMADFGYDVTDHLAVDPRYGTLGDVAALLEQAHARGVRVIIDLVANHTSVQHPWFLAAAAEPSGPYRPYYLWAGGGDGTAPNNWVSYFGGPAWTAHPDRGDHHLHLFLPEQADLNWRHPAVIDEFDRVVAHWLDLGVDGFRIDAAQTFVKDAALRPNPQRTPFDPAADRRTQWDSFEHRHDINQPETAAIFRRWQRACHRQGAVLLGETHIEEVADWAALVRRGGLDVAFWFGLIDLPWRADAVQAALRAPLDALAGATAAGTGNAGAGAGADVTIAWVTSTLDDVRAPTRLGGGDTGRRRALALLTLACALPGVPVLYQGEELGLTQGVLGEVAPADRIGARGEDSRDGCRTPMPWEPGPSFGFSPSGRSWLPDGGRTDADTAAAQVGVPGSWFERHRALLAVRKAEPALRARRPPVWFDRTGEGVVALRRGPLLAVANLGPDPVPVGMAGVVCFDSDGDSDGGRNSAGPGHRVAADEPLERDRALIVRLDDPPSTEAW